MKNLTSQSVVLDEKNALFLSGPIVKETVVSLLAQVKPFFSKLQTLHIDLSRATQCDSASLALLLELMRLAKQKNLSISFTNAPKQMTDIANVNGLAALLPIGKE